MRKSKPKPKLNQRSPEDIEILVECHLYKKFPEEFDSSHFAEKLADYIIRTTKGRRLTGPEVAKMVDDRAVNDGTISRAAERLADLLGASYSVEAIKQHQARYGKSHKELGKIRSRLHQQIIDIESKMSASDRKIFEEKWQELVVVLKRIDFKRVAKIRQAKNDIIARTVIASE